MKGLNPEFYHHKINLAKDAIPVQQRRYRLNPNYAAKVLIVVVEPDRGGAEEKRQITGLHRLPEVERSNHHGCLSVTVYGRGTRHGSWARDV
jgi:hypothetical protein